MQGTQCTISALEQLVYLGAPTDVFTRSSQLLHHGVPTGERSCCATVAEDNVMAIALCSVALLYPGAGRSEHQLAFNVGVVINNRESMTLRQ